MTIKVLISFFIGLLMAWIYTAAPAAFARTARASAPQPDIQSQEDPSHELKNDPSEKAQPPAKTPTKKMRRAPSGRIPPQIAS